MIIILASCAFICAGLVKINEYDIRFIFPAFAKERFFMLILEAVNLKKYYGDRLVISVDNLKIQSGDKIGIVGQNGAGKTTLLNILAGETVTDEGFVKRYCDIAYIRQFSDNDITAEAKTLKEFGVKEKLNCDIVSGGEFTRLKIADALSKNNRMLFADEPTSNLDYKGIELLEQKLAQVKTLFLISHDRGLLNKLCNKIIEVKDGKLNFYEGNFSTYQEQKREETNREWLEYGQYINKKLALEEAVRDRESRSKYVKKAPKRMGNSEARLHKGKVKEKKKKLDSAANIIKTRIEKLEIIQKPKENPTIKLDFYLTNPPENKIVISSKELSFSYGSNVIFNKASFNVYKGSKTAIIGNNGAGKTTLLNLIYNGDKSIYAVPRAVLGYFYQGFENLDHSKTILENVMRDSIQTETTARTILARLLIIGEDVHKSVQVLSGGERIKVSFAKLFVSNANVLLLDEPTNYLDMPSIETLENMLSDYEGTVLFVSHDKDFINKVSDTILILQNGKIERYEEEKSDIQESILEMRLTEIISKMSLSNCEKEALEVEYSMVLNQLKEVRSRKGVKK